MITILKETPIEIRIAITGWILIIKPITWLAVTPVTMATAETAVYLIDLASDQTSDSMHELTNAASVENAAPSVPWWGTNKKNATRNITISTSPIDISLVDISKLLDFDMKFIVIEKGKIAIDRTNSIVSPGRYCVPMMDSMNLGEEITAAIIGAFKLTLILELVDDKSVLNLLEIGITMYAILEAKLPMATMLIIRAI
jgi:hypothetical protein